MTTRVDASGRITGIRVRSQCSLEDHSVSRTITVSLAALRSFGIAKLWYLHLCSSQKDARHGNDHRLTRTAVPLLAYKPLPYLLPLSLPSFGRFRPETFSFYLA